MPSVIADLANAVAAFINDGAFEPEAQVKYLPSHRLSDLAAARITVTPRTLEIVKLDRSSEQYDVAIDVGVQQRVPDDQSDAEVAAAIGLVELLADYLKFQVLPTYPTAMFLGIANDPIYSQDHLREQHVFTSVLTLTYRIRR